MHFKVALLIIGIISMVLIPSALASRVEMAVKETATGTAITSAAPYSTCPQAITPQLVRVLVKNVGSTSDTYNLRFSKLPSGWDGRIQTDIPLGSGEERALDLFLINMPTPSSVLPGTYEIGIEAKSPSSGHSMEVILPIKILSCYALEVTSPTPSQDLCQEQGGSKEYSVAIKNSGKYAETYTLAATVSWASFSKTTISLSPGASETVKVTLSPPATLKGLQTVDITVASTSSYAKAGTKLQLNIKDCFDYSLSIRPTSDDVCTGESQNYDLEINNIGNTDTFTIQTTPSYVVPELKTVSVSTGKKIVKLTVTPKQKGILTFDVSVTSGMSNTTKKASASIDSQECRAVAVVISPSDKQACFGSTVEYMVTVKNTGIRTDTFTLTPSRGTLEKTSVTLNAGQSQTVKLSIPTSKNLSDEEIVTVSATSGEIIDSSNTILKLENCYDAKITLLPERTDVCPCSTASYSASLENTGKQTDSYTLTYSNMTEKVTLRAGEKRNVTFTVAVSCSQTTSSQVSVSASSPNLQVSDTSTLTVKSKNVCFGVDLSNGQNVTVNALQGVAIPVKVKNVGQTKQTFTLSLRGPEWMYISPTTISLTAGELKEVYVYASPPFGTKEGTYKATVTSSSEFVQATHELSVNVGKAGQVGLIEDKNITPSLPPQGNVTPTQPPTIEKPANETPQPPANDSGKENITNKTTTPGSGITLNVTFENLTGEIVRKTETPAFKTLAIGVIIFVIVIILVIRFAILVKK